MKSKMDQNLKLLKKIHDDAGSKSHIAITRDWSDEDPTLKYKDNTFFDQMYSIDGFMKSAKRIIDDGCEDSYFSINSFRRKEKQTCRTWHLNAFVLDFDFYKIDRYKDLSAEEMYNLHLKDKLALIPTSVIDSGRGLYLIYSFKHSCKSMIPTYNAIYKTFYNKFKDYGMDPKAMNVTQIIRLPGSFNSKAFKEVEILEFNDTNYKLLDFFDQFKYSQAEVKEFKQKKKINVKRELTFEELEKRFKFRDEQSKLIISDLKKLIELRNASGNYEGYREMLIYIVRKRMRWKDSSIQDELLIAHQINQSFKLPLANKEIEKNCTPYGMNRCFSIKTILNKLDITHQEQLHMKILRSKSLKDSYRQKRKRINILLNLTDKQRKILERRTNVVKLKREGKRNTQIANILTVDKSVITRDLNYINTHAWQFKKKLKEAMKELKGYVDTNYFIRFTRYDDQNELLQWLKTSEILLE